MAVIKLQENNPMRENVYLTKEERKILELTLPILSNLEGQSESFGINEIIDCLWADYDDNNRKLPAVVELI